MAGLPGESSGESAQPSACRSEASHSPAESLPGNDGHNHTWSGVLPRDHRIQEPRTDGWTKPKRSREPRRGWRTVSPLLGNPIPNNDVGLVLSLGVAVRRPYQSLAIAREHREPVESVAIGDAFQAKK